MKKYLLYFFAVTCVLCFAFKRPGETKAAATVEQQEGLFIFMLCKPVQEYTYLGTVKIKVAWTGEPSEMLNTSIKKVKKEYPAAEGIIFTSLDMDKADAIKFK